MNNFVSFYKINQTVLRLCCLILWIKEQLSQNYGVILFYKRRHASAFLRLLRAFGTYCHFSGKIRLLAFKAKRLVKILIFKYFFTAYAFANKKNSFQQLFHLSCFTANLLVSPVYRKVWWLLFTISAIISSLPTKTTIFCALVTAV